MTGEEVGGEVALAEDRVGEEALVMTTADGIGESRRADEGATPGNDQVALTWTASAGATSYNVKQATASGGPYAVIGSPAGTSFTDTTAADGTTYYYVVSAVNSGGEGANSGEASAMPVDPTVAPPAAPTGLSATPGDGKVLLSWTAPAGTVTGYAVEYGTQSGTYTASLPNISGTAAVVTGLTDGTPYFFAVQAVDAGGPGQSSNEASATPATGGPQWIVTDQNGKPIAQNTNDGSYSLRGPNTLSYTSTYPNDLPVSWLLDYPWPQVYAPNPVSVPLWFPTGALAGGLQLNGLAANCSETGIGAYNNGQQNEPLNGLDDATLGGTLSAFWWWMGAGSAPDYIDLLLSTSLTADASVAYYNSGLTSGLSATATATDGLGESVSSGPVTAPTPPASVYGQGNGILSNTAGSKTLVRSQVVGGAAEVYLDGQVSTAVSDAVPHDGVNSPSGGYTPGYGPTSAYTTASVLATAKMDNRAVTISANVDPTFHKDFKYDAQGAVQDKYGNFVYIPKINLRAADGTMTGDVGLPDQDGSGDNTTVNITYTASRPGAWAIYESVDQWNSSMKSYSRTDTLNFLFGLELGNLANLYLKPDPPHPYYNAAGDTVYTTDQPGEVGLDTITFSYQNGTYYVPGYPGSSALGAASTDSATVKTTYTMTTHAAYENVVKSDQPDSVSLPITAIDIGGDGYVRGNLDQAYSYETAAATTSGEIVANAALSTLLLTAPEWLTKLFELSGIEGKDLLPVENPGTTNFAGCWGAAGSTYLLPDGTTTPIAPDKSQMGWYKMYPYRQIGYTTQHFLVDHYAGPSDSSGYVGFVAQVEQDATAHKNGYDLGIGHFQYVGSSGD